MEGSILVALNSSQLSQMLLQQRVTSMAESRDDKGATHY